MVGGSNAGMAVMAFDQGDTKAGLAKAANYHNVGNSKYFNMSKTRKAKL